MAFRPAGALHQFVRMGIDRLRGIVYMVWVGWSVFLLLVVGVLCALAYALAAPWWLYWVVAALGLLLLAPVIFIGLVAMAAAKAWGERAEEAARFEAAAFAAPARSVDDERGAPPPPPPGYGP